MHYINEQDPVPHITGSDGALWEHLGRDAAVRVIPSDATGPNFDDHDFAHYLESHVPFEDARKTFPRVN